VLATVAGTAALQRIPRSRNGQDEDTGISQVGDVTDGSRGNETTRVRHTDVNEDVVRVVGTGDFHGFLAFAASRATSHVGARVGQRPERDPQQALVGGGQDAGSQAGTSPRSIRVYSVWSWIGRVVLTSKPPSGRGPACRFPPTEWARSRMPIRPYPPPGTAGVAAVPPLVTVMVKQELE
jgi:hypothetical protein